jgi:hypothetical protein
MGRRLFTITAAVSLVACAGVVALWVRSYVAGDYVRLGSTYYVSFARGDCRVVHRPWDFVPPYPFVGDIVVSMPLDRVGEYRMGSGAIYVPLWVVFAALLAAGIWARRKAHQPPRPGLCVSCGYDLRATPEKCPECGTVIAAKPGTTR